MFGNVLKASLQNHIVVSYELVGFRYQLVLLSRIFRNMFFLNVMKLLFSKNCKAKSKGIREKKRK